MSLACNQTHAGPQRLASASTAGAPLPSDQKATTTAQAVQAGADHIIPRCHVPEDDGGVNSDDILAEGVNSMHTPPDASGLVELPHLFEVDDLTDGDFDFLDRALVGLSARLGVHPTELVALRFGELPFVELSADATEERLRDNLNGAGQCGLSLGASLVASGALAGHAGAWVDRGLRGTPLDLQSVACGPVPEDVSTRQVLSRRPEHRHGWLADSGAVPGEPRSEGIDPGVTPPAVVAARCLLNGQLPPSWCPQWRFPDKEANRDWLFELSEVYYDPKAAGWRCMEKVDGIRGREPIVVACARAWGRSREDAGLTDGTFGRDTPEHVVTWWLDVIPGAPDKLAAARRIVAGQMEEAIDLLVGWVRQWLGEAPHHDHPSLSLMTRLAVAIHEELGDLMALWDALPVEPPPPASR